MTQTNYESTYGDVSIETDIVRDSIEIISATEDGIFSKLGKTKAIAMVHSYETDTLATPGSLAIAQGSDFAFSQRTTPSLLTNLVQEIAQPVAVTRPQVAVSHYTGQDELDRQMGKALKEFSNGIEFDLVRSTMVSGASGTVAKMNGIIQAISQATNTTVQTSGTVWSASILDGLMEECWEVSNGDVSTDIFTSGKMKALTDTFVQKTNNLVNLGEVRSIIRTVTTYETSMGTVTFHKHRYIFQPGDTNDHVLGIRPEKLKVAFLETPTVLNDLAISGAYYKRALYGSMTLEVRNQQSNFYCDGFLIPVNVG